LGGERGDLPYKEVKKVLVALKRSQASCKLFRVRKKRDSREVSTIQGTEKGILSLPKKATREKEKIKGEHSSWRIGGDKQSLLNRETRKGRE